VGSEMCIRDSNYASVQASLVQVAKGPVSRKTAYSKAAAAAAAPARAAATAAACQKIAHAKNLAVR